MSTQPAVLKKCLRPACLVGLFITSIFSLECDLLNAHLSRIIQQNVRLLSTNNSFPAECLRDRQAFNFPGEFLSYTSPMKRELMEAFYEMSLKVFNIYSQYPVKTAWEEKHQSQIQMGLLRQIEFLERCLKKEQGENGGGKPREENLSYSGAGEPPGSNQELQKYFSRIANFLKQKRYSDCAWKVVQVELRRCLYFFHNLAVQLDRDQEIVLLACVPPHSMGLVVIYVIFTVLKTWPFNTHHIQLSQERNEHDARTSNFWERQRKRATSNVTGAPRGKQPARRRLWAGTGKPEPGPISVLLALRELQ
ncbi:PREDICTED: interferon kappa [Elephantulus edwardii]|uniref:interferon kappa n=1 Tax=Elephantulus edwardii TaxID=28737 RepID=UPI0003F093F5|nr:PREDICTED: interferon kappa [Elephantulus edwardii]